MVHSKNHFSTFINKLTVYPNLSIGSVNIFQQTIDYNIRKQFIKNF